VAQNEVGAGVDGASRTKNSCGGMPVTAAIRSSVSSVGRLPLASLARTACTDKLCALSVVR
jgi:hypothetical protein